MPASGANSLLDANVWLAIAFSDHVHQAAAQKWFDGQPDASCAFCRITQLALLRHLTNQKIMGAFVQTQQQAWSAFDRLANDPRVTFHDEPSRLDDEFRALTQLPTASGRVWTDAYLAALAKTLPAQVVTFDSGFRQFAGINLIVLS